MTGRIPYEVQYHHLCHTDSIVFVYLSVQLSSSNSDNLGFGGRPQVVAIWVGSKARPVLHSPKVMSSECDGSCWFGLPMHSESLSSFSHLILTICILGETSGCCRLGRVEGPTSPTFPQSDELRMWWELLVWTLYAFRIIVQLFSSYSGNLYFGGKLRSLPFG